MKKSTCKDLAANKAAAPIKRKTVSRKPAGIPVIFTVHADKGKAVYLAGSFNDWNPTGKKMTFKAGVYQATIRLNPGEYQYKFVIDGMWCADPENINSVPNDCGTFNSVITVK